MPKHAFQILCAGLLAVAQMCGAEPSKAPKIEEIFRLTKVDEMQKQSLQQMRTMIANQMMQNVPQADRAKAQAVQNKIMDLVAQRMSWDNMKPQFINIYDETFTNEELDGILAFYKSPAGRSMLEKMPTVMTKSMAIAQEQIAAIMPELTRMMEDMKKE